MQQDVKEVLSSMMANECIFVFRKGNACLKWIFFLYLGHIGAEEALQAALHAAVVD
jgi:hypothetical protein